MTLFTEAMTHIAKKNHRCNWCWQKILSGELYVSFRFAEMQPIKTHSECYQAMQESAEKIPGFCGWSVGMDRQKNKCFT